MNLRRKLNSISFEYRSRLLNYRFPNTDIRFMYTISLIKTEGKKIFKKLA